MSRVTDKALQTALEKTKLYVDKEADKLRGDTPAKLSQLVNDNHTVTDESYVHTDNNFTEVDKAVVGSLPSTILTNPHVIASGGETYLNVTYDMAELVDGTYSKTTKTVSILSANPATNRAGLMSGPDKIKLDGIEEGANNYVLPAASSLVRGGVVLNTAWQAPTLVSEEADDKDLPLEIANESSASGILKPTCKVYVDDVPTEDSNKFLLSGAVHTALQGKADRTELSNVIAEEPLTPDNFTDINTYTREELKKDLFIDMWNQAWKIKNVAYGKYDPDNAPDAEHPFMGNDIWMTYDEAIAVMRYSTPRCVVSNSNNVNPFYLINRDVQHPRTILPVFIYGNSIEWLFGWQNELEFITISYYNDIESPLNLIKYSFCFQGCMALRVVKGELRFVSSNTSANQAFCTMDIPLEQFHVRTAFSLDFSHFPKLNLESFQFLVTNASNTSAINITVHANVYAKLTDESNTEWHALLAQAAEKNITFATV